MAEAATAKLDIGKVISGTFRIINADLANILTVAGLFIVLPSVLVGILQISTAAPGAEITSSPLYVAGNLAAAIPAMIGGAGLVRFAYELVNGRQERGMTSVQRALQRVPALIWLSFLQTLAVLLGLLLLVVPGVMLALAWAVTTPAVIVGKLRVMESFKESSRLTRDNRWRILGLFAIYLVAVVIIAGALGLLSGLTVIVGGGWISTILIEPLITAALYVPGYIGVSVLYADLKTLKDGSASESLAQIFD